MENKKQFRWFSIFEYEKEQDYLRVVAAIYFEYL